MATKKRKLNTSPYRVLLSDVLPYEVPMYFSMSNLYKWADRVKLIFSKDGKTLIAGRNKYKESKSINAFLNIINGDISRPKHSYSYFINKDGKETGRELTLIHPYDAIRMVFFYKDCDGQIINSCRRSQFSLRYPHHVAISVKIKEPLVPTLVKKYTSYKVTDPRTYFSYQNYNNINAFYDNKRFLRLQSQYRKYYKSDIHHCFDTIPAEKLYEAAYLTDKSITDNNNFANRFYGLMKDMRIKTNGIIIGPEFSRLYAEIILPRIDNEIMTDMEKAGQVLHQDYECFRYLDDMFMFYDSDKTLELFKKIYGYRLMSWGMSPNEKKEEFAVTPFITPQSIAKNEIESLLYDASINKLVDSSLHGEIRSMAPPVPYTFNANNFYHQLLTIIKKNDVELNKVSSYLLTRLQKISLKAINEFDDILEKYIEAEKEEMLDQDGLKNLKRYLSGMAFFLRQLLKVTFLIFESDIRMSTSIKTVMIVDSIVEYVNSRLFKGNQISLTSDLKVSIYKFVRDELTNILKSHKLRQINGLEICNLMTISSDLSDGYGISNDVWMDFINGQFDLDQDENKHGVNFLMAFALLRSLKPSNVLIKNEIIKWLEYRLDIKKWDVNDTECCYIILCLSNLLNSTERKEFDMLAKKHSIETAELGKLTTAFMQWTGVSLQKACTEKVSADVY